MTTVFFQVHDGKEYDAFVCYNLSEDSNHDIETIKNKLVSELEEQHHFKLCLPERDLQSGCIATNINHAITKSRRIIIIIFLPTPSDQMSRSILPSGMEEDIHGIKVMSDLYLVVTYLTLPW